MTAGHRMQGALSFDTLAVLTPARDIDSSGRHGPTRNPSLAE
ncbi:hypothetical protein I552_1238 [Mycobacterium xenopi 3993]|nr:hypothetical protein I552_1238 [Mycobacterium xenopi 3993]